MSFFYSFKEAYKSFAKEKSTSMVAILSLAFALLVFNFFILLVYNLKQTAGQIKDKIGMTVYLKDDLKDEEIQLLAGQIETLQGIERVVFKSKADALVEMEDYLGKEVVEGLEENPLPNSFTVQLTKDSRIFSQMESLAGKIEALSGVEGVEYGKSWVGKLERIFSLLLLVLVVFGICLTLAVVFIVSTTIRLLLASHLDSVALLKLLGATKRFVKRPFLLQGGLLGFSGSLISLGLLFVVYKIFAQKFFEASFLPAQILFYLVIWILVLGMIGSSYSFERYWKTLP